MKLVVVSGPRAGEEIEIDREQVIGRGEADIVIDDPKLSRRHAVVRTVEGGLEVEDLGSLNGTEVDGRRIAGAVRLQGGERIRVCATTIEVVADVAEPGAQPQPAVTALEEAPAAPIPSAPASGAPAPAPRAPAPGAPTPTPAAQAPFDTQPAGQGPTRPTGFPRPAASLLWGPTLLCVLIIIAVAIAEVAYFASR